MVNAASNHDHQTKAQKRPKPARLWWLVHQWVGLKLSLFLAFILFTGTLAVFSNEIDWLINPSQRVDARTVKDHDWAAMAKGAASVVRPGETIASLEAPTDRGFSAQAVINQGDRGDDGPPPRLVFLHPTTGHVLGQGSWLTAQRILRNGHRHLFLPTKIGVPIVSSVSILLLISLVTSFIVYKKWWRGFFRPIRWRDARTAWGDAHRLMGLWGLWFVALMGVTGLWYLVESLGGDAPNHPKPKGKIVAVSIQPASLVGGFPKAFAAARAQNPNLRIQRIGFPTKKSGAYQFQGDYKAILVRPRANTVWVEAKSNRALLSTDGHDLNAHQRISEAADPLHFGTWGGVWSKILYLVFGLGLTGLCVSGAAIYSGRLLKPVGQVKLAVHLGTMWTGMGIWRWPALAGVLTFALLLPNFVVEIVTGR